LFRRNDRRIYDLTLTKKGKEKGEYINTQCNNYYKSIFENIPEEKHGMIIESIFLLGNAMKDKRAKQKMEKCQLFRLY